MGILVESPDLAKQIVNATLEQLPRNSYRVELNDKERLRWTSVEGDQIVVYKREPDASLWRRFTAGFLRLLPIRGQL
jgi:putative cardiolipin synthase